MNDLKTLDNLDVADMRVLVRVDFNVPMKDGKVTNDARIRQAVPTIRELLDKGAAVVLASHMGRPKGETVSELSMAPLVDQLRRHLPSTSVTFNSSTIGDNAVAAAGNLKAGEVLLMENLRFHPGEEANDPKFAAELAALADIYVDDAFSCAHRAHASVAAIAHLLPAAAGRLMEQEIDALSSALGDPKRPAAAVIGGSKISTKLAVLENLATKVDYLVIGGAMANTFLLAQGMAVGRSLAEADMVATVADIQQSAEANNCLIIVPEDVVVAPAFAENTAATTISVDAVPTDQMILDVGSKSVEKLVRIFEECHTVLWNGPLGAFEIKPFQQGTEAAAQAVAKLTREKGLLSVAGGGDTVAALEGAGVAGDFSYVSMAGGAFLEWLEGRELPGVAVLRV